MNVDEQTSHVTVEALRTGDTIEIGPARHRMRYTVDHVEPVDAMTSLIHTTTTLTVKADRTAGIVRVTRRGIPSPAAADDGAAGRVVHYWSGMVLHAPAVLVARRDLRPGDVFQSSHGYVLTFARREGLLLFGLMPGGTPRSEAYPLESTVPVFFDTPAARDELIARAHAPRPDTLTEEDDLDLSSGALAELVREQALAEASQVIDDGRAVEYLLARGWTTNQLRQRASR